MHISYSFHCYLLLCRLKSQWRDEMEMHVTFGQPKFGIRTIPNFGECVAVYFHWKFRNVGWRRYQSKVSGNVWVRKWQVKIWQRLDDFPALDPFLRYFNVRVLNFEPRLDLICVTFLIEDHNVHVFWLQVVQAHLYGFWIVLEV